MITLTGHKRKKAPPLRLEHDRKFQRNIVRLLYQDHEFSIAVEPYLKPQSFDLSTDQWMVEQIFDYAKLNSHSIPAYALKIKANKAQKAGRLDDLDVIRINKLISTLDRPVKDRSFIEQEVFRFTKGQSIRDMFMDALPYYEAGDYEKIDPLITEVLNVQRATQGGMGHFFVSDVGKRTKRRKEPVVPGIPTGLKLDNHLKHGGMIPGRIYCVLAPPNSGKTMTMVHMGGSAVVESPREERILHIDLEQDEDDVADLYDAFFSRIQISSLTSKPRKIQKLVKGLGRKYGEFLVIKSFPNGTLTMTQLKAYIRQLERKAFYPTIITIDYPQIMADEEAGKYDDEHVSLGRLIVRLKALGGETRAAVLAGLQGTRDSLGSEIIDMNKIAASFKTAAHADVIMAICQTIEEARRGRARYFLAKNKFGLAKVEMKARVDWARCLIRNI